MKYKKIWNISFGVLLHETVFFFFLYNYDILFSQKFQLPFWNGFCNFTFVVFFSIEFLPIIFKF